MIVTEKERERRRQKRFKEQVRQRELRLYWNPVRDMDLERIWVAYVWTPHDSDRSDGEWHLAGFRRKRSLRKRQTMNGLFAKVRRKLEIDKKSFMMLRDLDEAARRVKEDDQSWVTQPPRFRRPKPIEKIVRTPIPKHVKRKPRRAKVKAYIFNKKRTKYVALGRFSWNRSPKYLYLGPLASAIKRSAQFEAKRLFGVYDDLLVISADELSKPLRDAMARSKRVRAGVTRIVWPEVPPTFEKMWSKFAKRFVSKELNDAVPLDDPRMIDVELALRSEWEAQGSPWLTLNWFHKQLKPWRPQCDAPKKRKRKIVRRRSTSKRRIERSPSRSKKKFALKRATIKSSLKRLCIRRVNAKLKRKQSSSSSPKRSASRSAVSSKTVVRVSLSWLGGNPNKQTILAVASRKDVRVVKEKMTPR